MAMKQEFNDRGFLRRAAPVPLLGVVQMFLPALVLALGGPQLGTIGVAFATEATVTPEAAPPNCFKAPHRACVFDEALRLARSAQSSAPNPYVFAHVATSIAKSGARDQAKSIFATALEVAESVDDRPRRAGAYQAIAEAQATSGFADDAQRSFLSAAEALKIGNSDGQRITALKSLGKALAKAGLSNESAETFGLAKQAIELIPISQRATQFEYLAQDEAEAGIIADALETSSMIADDTSRGAALAAIAVAQAKAGNLLVAIATAKAIQNEFQGYDALADIAAHLAQSGRIQDALELARSIEDGGTRAKALISIGLEQAKGNKEGAAASFNEAYRLAIGIDAEHTRALALMNLAAAEQTVGLDGQAKEYFANAVLAANKIPEIGFRARILTQIAKEHCGHGFRKDAAETIKLALVDVRSEEKNSSQAYTIAEIGYAQAIAGLLPESLASFAEAKELLQSVSESQRDEAMGFLRSVQYSGVTAHLKQGNIAGALEVIQSMDNSRWSSSCLALVAQSQAKGGSIPDALSTAQTIPDPAQRAFALSQVAIYLPE
jgi:tetratricopeptide (TPR) repeat protein